MKCFNNSTSDDTYDDEIKCEINDFRLTLCGLGNIVTKQYRKEIKKELYKIEKKQNLLDNKKEEIYDHDDLNYFGIKELENLFGDTDNDYYYKLIYYKELLINTD